tara:strand:- start:1215 stop:1967 length:753 start_codon:yes stop_codon:yes gene_type:complete
MPTQICQAQDSKIKDLLSGKIHSLEIPNIISQFECDSLSKKILSNYETTSGPGLTTKIGTSLSSYIYDKTKYFSNAQKSNLLLQNLFSNTNPIDKIKKTVSQLFQKEITTANEDGMPYSYCMIRIHKNGDSVHVHRDNCNFEMPDYTVSKYQTQLSAILYLQSPQSGGELKIYHKQWSKSDESHRHPEFGYSYDVIDGSNYDMISPITGNLVILNPNFYHQIEPVLGKKHRISIGFFFGESREKKLYNWS